MALVNLDKISQMLIPPTGRGVAVGMTGCGKTTLAEHLLSIFNNVACIDPKGMLRWRGYTRLSRLRDVVKCPETRIIYSPNAEELRDPDFHEAFFLWVYDRTNTFCYIDEAYAVTAPSYIPPSLHAILTRGRERGTGILNSTQRPMQIPNVIMSEAENWYVFRLSMPADRKKVCEICPGINPDEILMLPKREFVFCRADEDYRTRPVTLELPKTSQPASLDLATGTA